MALTFFDQNGRTAAILDPLESETGTQGGRVDLFAHITYMWNIGHALCKRRRKELYCINMYKRFLNYSTCCNINIVD